MSDLAELQKEKADLLTLRADILERAIFKKRIGQATTWEEIDSVEVEQRIASIEARIVEAMRK